MRNRWRFVRPEAVTEKFQLSGSDSSVRSIPRSLIDRRLSCVIVCDMTVYLFLESLRKIAMLITAP